MAATYRDLSACCSRRDVRSAFSLIELLVVIGIISLLVALLVPALSSARREARAAACSANLRSLMSAVYMYAGGASDADLGDEGAPGFSDS